MTTEIGKPVVCNSHGRIIRSRFNNVKEAQEYLKKRGKKRWYIKYLNPRFYTACTIV